MQEYLSICNRILRSIGTRFHSKLIECGALCPEPDGGFYLFPDFGDVPGIEKMMEQWSIDNNRRKSRFGSKDFTMYLLNQCGVAGLGGAYFGRPDMELTMRLSYVDFNGTKIFENKNEIPQNEMSIQMDEFLNKYCTKTMNGIDVLTEYMKSLSK